MARRLNTLRTGSVVSHRASFFWVISLFFVPIALSCDNRQSPAQTASPGESGIVSSPAPYENIAISPSPPALPDENSGEQEGVYDERGTPAGYFPRTLLGQQPNLDRADSYELSFAETAAAGAPSNNTIPVSVSDLRRFLPLPGKKLLVLDASGVKLFDAATGIPVGSAVELDHDLLSGLLSGVTRFGVYGDDLSIRSGSREYPVKGAAADTALLFPKGAIREPAVTDSRETVFGDYFTLDTLELPAVTKGTSGSGGTDDKSAEDDPGVLVQTRGPDGRVFVSRLPPRISFSDGKQVDWIRTTARWTVELPGPRTMIVTRSGSPRAILTGGRETLILNLDTGVIVSRLENPYGWSLTRSALRNGILVSWSWQGVLARDLESGGLLWAAVLSGTGATVVVGRDALVVADAGQVGIFAIQTGLRMAHTAMPAGLDTAETGLALADGGIWLVPRFGQVRYLDLRPGTNVQDTAGFALLSPLPGEKYRERFAKVWTEPPRRLLLPLRQELVPVLELSDGEKSFAVDRSALPMNLAFQASEGSKWRLGLPVVNASGLKITVTGENGVELDSNLDYTALHDSLDLTFSGETRIFVSLDLHGAAEPSGRLFVVSIEPIHAETTQ